MTRRTAALLALVVAAVMVTLAGCDEDSSPVVEENEVYSIELPSGYDEVDDDQQENLEGEVGGEAEEDLGGQLRFDVDNVWTKEPEDGFATNINVITEPLPGDIDIEEYRRLSVDNAEALGLSLTNEGEDTTLDGEPAFLYEGTLSEGDLDAKVRGVSAIRDGVAYTVTFTAPEDRFDDEVGDLDETLETWTWTD